MLPSLAIFAVVYVLVSARRVGRLPYHRPIAALVGALACLAFGLASPREALAAIDGSTLLLLLGMMGMGAFLALDGFFARAADALAARARTQARLLACVVWGSGFFSALITNDAVCVLGAPLVVKLIQRHGLPPLPFLLALATAANSGSAATLVGNPQNMLCAYLGGLEYGTHLSVAAPVALVALALNHALLLLLFRGCLDGPLALAEEAAHRTPRVVTPRAAVALVVLAGTAVAYTLGADLAWTAIAGFGVLLLFVRAAPLEVARRIDWSVLVFFAGLFVVVDALVRGGAPAAAFERFPLRDAGVDLASWLRLSAVFLVGSNVVSNVPFILVVRPEMGELADPWRAWELLAIVSTFAGNLTVLGSVANVIVAEKGASVGGFGFWQYLRVGLPLALLSSAAAACWLWVV